MVHVEFDDQEIRRALQGLLAASGNMTEALSEIGEHLAESTLHRFETKSGPDGTRWDDNSPVTIERKGRNDPLIHHGSLSEQIEARLLGNDTLAVGSTMEYAAMQQFGGTKAEFPHLWGDIPARPFIGISADDEDEILKIIAAYLRDAVG